MERAAVELGLPIAREAFIDRHYDDGGNLQSRTIVGSVIRDAAIAAERAVRMVLDREILSFSGRRMPTGFESLCIHGDEPTAIAVARACHDAMRGAGIDVVTIPEMVGGGR